MGNKVLMQVYNSDTNKFGPAVYGHWSGSDAKDIAQRLKVRMHNRIGDVDYSSARLVQEMINNEPGDGGFGIFNVDKILTIADSHGDAGIVLIDCFNDHEPTFIGGYLSRDPA